MYQSFYGLNARPFNLTADIEYLLLTPKHQEAIAHLEYGMSFGTGITLLLGEPGTGKTTLLNKVLASMPSQSRAGVVSLTNPALSRNEFFDFVAHGFGLSPVAAGLKTQLLRELQSATFGNGSSDTAVFVIDEAQALPDDLLEEVRLLANIQSSARKLLRVILAGQPSLGVRLNEPRFLQLKQRIGLRCVLAPLDLHETASYIAHRIGVAGGNPARIFSRDAVIAIYERATGIPRTINVICENALLTGFAADQRPIEPDIIREVCSDLDLTPRVPVNVAPPAAVQPRPNGPSEPPGAPRGNSWIERATEAGSWRRWLPTLRVQRR